MPEVLLQPKMHTTHYQWRRELTASFQRSLFTVWRKVRRERETWKLCLAVSPFGGDMRV